MNGYIVLHRKIQDHWLWKDKERFQWWVDLLFMANFEDKEVMDDSHLFVLKRGQLIASVSFLSVRWGKSAPTIIKFLKLLQANGMILRETLYRQTPIVTICNYDTYQLSTDNSVYTQVNRQVNTQVYTIKENKESKKENKKNHISKDIRKKVKSEKEQRFDDGMKNAYPRVMHMKQPLTYDQYNKLLEKGYTPDVIRETLEAMENYKKLDTYVSSYLTLNKWLSKN